MKNPIVNNKNNPVLAPLRKRILCALFGIFLEPILDALHHWHENISYSYLLCCRYGCENCYAWRCCARRTGATPYKKWRSAKTKYSDNAYATKKERK